MKLRDELNATAECLQPDRFTETLTEGERAHLQTCVRCQTELALWREVVEREPAADEGAAVRWIVAELGRRTAPTTIARAASPAAWRRWLTPLVGLAAAAAVVLAVFSVVRPTGPLPSDSDVGDVVYRTATVTVTSPVGEVAAPPRELTWAAYDGAVLYNVEVSEIDRTVLWRASSTSSSVILPDTLVARFAPGKPVLWEVTALDDTGRTLASSGTQRFRVRFTPPAERE